MNKLNNMINTIFYFVDNINDYIASRDNTDGNGGISSNTITFVKDSGKIFLNGTEFGKTSIQELLSSTEFADWVADLNERLEENDLTLRQLIDAVSEDTTGITDNIKSQIDEILDDLEAKGTAISGLKTEIEQDVADNYVAKTSLTSGVQNIVDSNYIQSLSTFVTYADVNSAEAAIVAGQTTELGSKLATIVTKVADGNSSIHLSADQITIDGNMVTTGSTLANTIYATRGTIGGFDIQSDKIYNAPEYESGTTVYSLVDLTPGGVLFKQFSVSDEQEFDDIMTPTTYVPDHTQNVTSIDFKGITILSQEGVGFSGNSGINTSAIRLFPEQGFAQTLFSGSEYGDEDAVTLISEDNFDVTKANSPVAFLVDGSGWVGNGCLSWGTDGSIEVTKSLSDAIMDVLGNQGCAADSDEMHLTPLALTFRIDSDDVQSELTGTHLKITEDGTDAYTEVHETGFHIGTDDEAEVNITAGVVSVSTYNSADDEYNTTTIRGTGIVVPGTIQSNSSITASSFIKTNGTSSQFLKADGSVDSNTYLTLTVGQIRDMIAAAVNEVLDTLHNGYSISYVESGGTGSWQMVQQTPQAISENPGGGQTEP